MYLKEPLKEEGLTNDPNGNPMTGSLNYCCCYKWLTFVHLIALHWRCDYNAAMIIRASKHITHLMDLWLSWVGYTTNQFFIKIKMWINLKIQEIEPNTKVRKQVQFICASEDL